ncbi:MAG: sensor histidine kinase [Sulfurospirillaceae bacterium]|nr:sensor histidine kinase [Sulfurospirillaceae bacterium]
MVQAPSVKSRLILWLIVPLSLFSFFLFIYINSFLRAKVNTFFDNRLFASAQSIEDYIGVENGKLIIDFQNFSIDYLSPTKNGLMYYSVVDDKGDLLIGYQFLFNKNLLAKQNKRFYDKIYDGEKLRVVSYKTTINSSGKVYTAYISIAESYYERAENIRELINTTLIIMSLVSLFTIIITLIAVNVGLKPLVSLKRSIRQRDKRDLTPFEFQAPKEIEDVVNSINILLERSRDNIEYIEQFNSDVSHQLRTPLAEMKMELEEFFEKKDQKYIVLNAHINDMSHIIEQLLLYAKTNPNTINLTRLKKANLNQICKDYCVKTAPRIYHKGFEFEFEDLDEKVFIKTDPIILESMLDNIINNSLHYAVDKNGNPMGKITLSIQRHNNAIWLNVKDEGKGVKEELLENIFQRYYRVDLKKNGSGLGLSIVKQIAILHNAEVLASNDNGLKISIIFPYPES